jgi:hypothetical protein
MFKIHISLYKAVNYFALKFYFLNLYDLNHKFKTNIICGMNSFFFADLYFSKSLSGP